MDETETIDETGRLDPVHRAKLALQRCKTIYAPDSRVVVFDVTPKSDGDGLSLHGTVSAPRLERKAREEVAHVTGRATTSDLTVLEALRTEETVTRSVVSVRGDADDEAEQVTQVLYGARVGRGAGAGANRRVRVGTGRLSAKVFQ
jgi:hypothetical protein